MEAGDGVSRPTEIMTADRKQRAYNGTQSVIIIIIGLLLLAGLIAWSILWGGNDLVITTSNTALKTTYILQFQVIHTWGDCPLATSCDENAAVQTINGTIASLPTLVSAGTFDGSCSNVRAVGVDDHVSQCSWTISFNGGASIPVGTVEIDGAMYFLGPSSTEQQLVQMAVTGGSNNYMNPNGGDLVFAYNVGNFNQPYNMTLTIITVD